MFSLDFSRLLTSEIMWASLQALWTQRNTFMPPHYLDL